MLSVSLLHSAYQYLHLYVDGYLGPWPPLGFRLPGGTLSVCSLPYLQAPKLVSEASETIQQIFV